MGDASLPAGAPENNASTVDAPGATGGTPLTNARGVSRAEQGERRKLMLDLIANRAGKEETLGIMRETFSMTEQASDRLRRRVEAEIVEDGRELLPIVRAKQVSRLNATILRARKAGSWNAVVAAERLLAQIQGTLEPTRVDVNIDATVREAVVHVMGGMSENEIAGLMGDSDTPHRNSPTLPLLTTDAELVEMAGDPAE